MILECKGRRAAARPRHAGAVSSPAMRRLLRWAFNLAAAVSALLFVGVCVLWVRSYQRIDDVRTMDRLGCTEWFSHRGGFWIGRIDSWQDERVGLEPLSDAEGNEPRRRASTKTRSITPSAS